MQKGTTWVGKLLSGVVFVFGGTFRSSNVASVAKIAAVGSPPLPTAATGCCRGLHHLIQTHDTS